MSRRFFASVTLALVASFVLSACTDCHKCFKDPPCKPVGCDAPAAPK